MKIIHTDPTLGRWPDHEAGTRRDCDMCVSPGAVTNLGSAMFDSEDNYAWNTTYRPAYGIEGMLCFNCHRPKEEHSGRGDKCLPEAIRAHGAHEGVLK